MDSDADGEDGDGEGAGKGVHEPTPASADLEPAAAAQGQVPRNADGFRDADAARPPSTPTSADNDDDAFETATEHSTPDSTMQRDAPLTPTSPRSRVPLNDVSTLCVHLGNSPSLSSHALYSHRFQPPLIRYYCDYHYDTPLLLRTTRPHSVAYFTPPPLRTNTKRGSRDMLFTRVAARSSGDLFATHDRDSVGTAGATGRKKRNPAKPLPHSSPPFGPLPSF